jgi:Delta7-sterol 5-desaturase
MPTDPFRSWLAFVGASLLVTAVTFWGLGGVVHYIFYARRREAAAQWKIQPRRFLSAAVTRHAFFLGSANILLGSIVGGTFAWYVARGGWSSIYFDAGKLGVLWLPVSAVILFFMIDAGLYYSHRAFHGRTLFRYIHRHHHKYVAPVVFTTTAVHPIEFLTFEAFLILPAFVLPVHWAVYVVVIAYTYLIGMIDHCGVKVRWPLPLHGDNKFHDDHHVYFHCNYAHHTQVFDRLHGTVRDPGRHYDEHTFGGRGAPRSKASKAEEHA